MYLFVALDLSKEMDLPLHLPPLPNCDNLGQIKLNHDVVSNTHSDPLHELIHKKVCPFQNTHPELFEHIKMRKQNISFKI